ncbi:hypothetical protein DERF_003738 [Dermatophagoides farinae]|uniref:Uncharacterized protein n=1 Tax=Dermatophagoides farinae TaxID=6954 RepID=A0A922IFW0_DERFA|nr:hypothetical protein DERF_003738 [Dermatophagoides farinae]
MIFIFTIQKTKEIKYFVKIIKNIIIMKSNSQQPPITFEFDSVEEQSPSKKKEKTNQKSKDKIHNSTKKNNKKRKSVTLECHIQVYLAEKNMLT